MNDDARFLTALEAVYKRICICGGPAPTLETLFIHWQSHAGDCAYREFCHSAQDEGVRRAASEIRREAAVAN